MKVGVVIGPKDAQFSAPFRCQRSLLAQLHKLDTDMDIVPVEDKVPRDLDLLHVDNIPFTHWEWWRVRKAKRVVAHAHGNLLWAHPELMENRLWDRMIMRSWASLSRKHIDRVLPVSNYLRYSLMFESWDPDRMLTVYNGIDPLFFSGRKGHRPIKGRYIFHVSKYQPKKNTEALVDAFPAIKREFPDHQLVIAGLGHKVNDDVRYLGKVSMERLHRLYSHADLFIFPTLHETFGLPVVEAMATGCPVITTRRGAIPEVCEDAVIYTSPNPTSIARTAIEALESPERLRRCRDRGRNRARLFSWESAASDVLGLYEEVLG